MAKGYWIARVDVSDPQGYTAYQIAAAKIFADYGGRFIVRGGRSEALEGTNRSRNVVIEFDSYDMALACYRSPEYAQVMALRTNLAAVDLVVAEGGDEAAPA
jgi:uncharacterized protein (DUF1330 family)